MNNKSDDEEKINEPVWNWTDSYSSGVYKINNDGSVEHVKLQCSKTETNAAQKKIKNILENGENLEEEGFGEILREKSKIESFHIIILISFILLLGIWFI
jgi:hypothetical protein